MWVELGLKLLFHALREKTRMEDDSFDCPVFTMRPYCSCEGEKAGHENGCPDNFIYKKTGFTVNWYKHIGRGMEHKHITVEDWSKILIECLNAVYNR